jgi:hypothetical protein
MVMVSHAHDFVFLKTRKTAGTSVEMVLEPFCRPPGCEVFERTRTLKSAYGIVGRRLMPRPPWHRFLMITDWYNHMPARAVRAALGAERWDRYRKITCIRNPFDLAVSRFHWELARHDIPEATDFAETRKRFHDMVMSGRFDCDHGIVHIDGQYVADETVMFERLSGDLEKLVSSINPGAAKMNIPHTKKTANRRQQPVAAYFDTLSIAAIHKSAAWVFERFNYPETPGG